MPSKSKKQSKLMTAACKNKDFRDKVGITKKVACDFHDADKGKFHEDISVDHDSIDIIKMDIPLLLRIFEFVREDLDTDISLHELTENIINVSKTTDVLTMDEYTSIIENIKTSQGISELSEIKRLAGL